MNTKHIEGIVKEHHANRFTNDDSLAVTIHETEYGNYQIRERALMGNGNAAWFFRHIVTSLEEAVTYCQLYYRDGAPNSLLDGSGNITSQGAVTHITQTEPGNAGDSGDIAGGLRQQTDIARGEP